MTSRPETSQARGNRRVYLDWARGLAVLIMIEAHVLDAWTLRSERSTTAFGYLNIVGGFAAPLFLWLAGVSLVLASEAGLRRTGDRGAAARVLMRRGLEIFVLAFVFRAQSFIVSPGNPLVSLLRVDILNIMGPSMMAAAALWWVGSGSRLAALVCGGAATALALVTPIVRTQPWLASLPPAVQWYISPVGNHSTFTLFPWSGFVFAGAAFGALLAMADQREEGRALARLSAAGLVIAVASYWASYQPTVYASSSFWTTSPTYFGLRVGTMMLFTGVLFILTPANGQTGRLAGMLARFGRHSLFVYWVHVELVYGYATALIHHRLPLALNAVVYLLFLAAMYRLLDVRDKVASWWKARRTASVPSTSVLT